MEKIFLNKTWLNTDETALYLGKTRNAVWLLVSKGTLIKRKWNRRLYFKRAELDQLLETSFL
ncbi:helix-turn-helix domain-containing protein [Halobacteriovorax sp. RZ-2]|uniref:helix-turn-helix domain-containing protein n=1 Tax=unclassified Halobacteriovorax TaxID=2639665 RepID=UPI003712935A